MKECQWRKRLSGLFTDAEERKHREQTGLDTLVVYAVNDECYFLGCSFDEQGVIYTYQNINLNYLIIHKKFTPENFKSLDLELKLTH